MKIGTASENHFPDLKAAVSRYWFVISLVLVFFLTAGDPGRMMSPAGLWLKSHGGPSAVIFTIFLLSGLLLEPDQMRAGLNDVKGTGIALIVIFLAAPLLAVIPALMPLDDGVKIGIFLVAVMPTTLSSGVVMTGIAGGNIAHALVITVVSNTLAIVTIPYALRTLLTLMGFSTSVVMDPAGMMIKLGILVLVPLGVGIGVKWWKGDRIAALIRPVPLINQVLILVIVWMSLTAVRSAVIGDWRLVVRLCLGAALYHGALLGIAAALSRMGGLARGRWESVVFMGAQKTLTLSIILQMSLFPEYGVALAFSVLHHIIHMLMDGYLAARLRP